ncbi:DUF4271 domain-containing protein [Galbibacter sp. EGI 63066]|uniref:DUF4271 domain-containing protein n=1 Tax=Galbibacter sp. EGI 63066 TaxID=2993559 RepID=UPI0022494DE3|nr:DUF4271 domain-containing protein [Galbibacter sp. EGI 63066]MCX2678816.1 DUF4271 domain-containing protein [Galbibacter sp. EGI 63066]
MNEVLRHIDSHTTETILLFAALLSLTVAKLIDEHKFQSFTMLFVNHNYFNIFNRENKLTTSNFNIFLFIPQLITFSLVVWITIEFFDLSSKIPVYIILPFLLLFILFKFYLEKMIATIFDINTFAESFHFHKVTYRNFSSLILLPLITLFIYSDLAPKIVLYVILFVFLSINIITIILTLRNHQKEIGKYLFYFILYLCALEIAPYLILIKFYFIDKASN